MDKNKVKLFFDKAAAGWDDNLIINEKKINKILDNADLKADLHDKSVLDVACGTGVMIPFYLSRGVKDVIGIDISEEMIQKAKRKFPDINFVCADVETYDFKKEFDYIVVYNAFPHFPSSVKIIECLSGLLKEGGILTVAHGMGRRHIDNHHKGAAADVSNGLISAKALANIFKYYRLEVTCEFSDEEMYQVVGRKTMHDLSIHSHEHFHENITAFESSEQAVKLLSYMLEHNVSHADELHEICHKLEASGKSEAANLIDEAVGCFRDGNSMLELAIDNLKKAGE